MTECSMEYAGQVVSYEERQAAGERTSYGEDSLDHT